MKFFNSSTMTSLASKVALLVLFVGLLVAYLYVIAPTVFTSDDTTVFAKSSSNSSSKSSNSSNSSSKSSNSSNSSSKGNSCCTNNSSNYSSSKSNSSSYSSSKSSNFSVQPTSNSVTAPGPKGSLGNTGPLGAPSNPYGVQQTNLTPKGGRSTVSITSCGGNCTEIDITYYDRNGNVRGRSVHQESEEHGGGQGTYVGDQPVSPCVGLPDLDITAVEIFDLSGTNTSPNNSNSGEGFGQASNSVTEINPGQTYAPQITIRNRGCVSTNGVLVKNAAGIPINWYPLGLDLDVSKVGGGAGADSGSGTTFTDYIATAGRTTSPVYMTDLPHGINGSFPVRMQIDFNYDTDPGVDLSEYVDMMGPLFSNQSIEVGLPAMEFPVGNHRITAYADIPGTEDPGHGCDQAAGCITEPPTDNNTMSIIVTVTEPTIELGSYLRTGTNPFWMPVSDIQTGNRNISDGDTVGLYWTGAKVNFSTCTGRTETSSGSSLSDFSGQRDGWHLGAYTRWNNRYDINITEPVSGEFHRYIITCSKTSGGTISDTLIINNGVDISDSLTMNPNVNSFTVDAGQVRRNINFTVTNNSSDADDTSYTMTIDGTQVGSGGSIDVPASGRSSFSHNTNGWRAPATVPASPPVVEVCISHPNMGSGSRCVSANVMVIEPPPPPPPGAEPPEISVDPIIVRKGEEFTLRWDTKGHTGCSLSANANADGSASGDTLITAQNQSTYTITCDGGSDDATIKVLPVIYET